MGLTTETGEPVRSEDGSRGPTEVGTPNESLADPCARCGYDLRGVADDAPCPECGLLAERSRQRDGHLSDATPGWLRGIAVGVSLALLAHGIAAIWFVVLLVATESYAVQRMLLAWPMRPLDVALIGFDVAALTLVVGAWLLARPQHVAARDGGLRTALRIASLMPVAALGLLHFASHFAGFGMMTPRLAFAVLLMLTLGVAPIPAIAFTLLRRLAKRVLDPSLAEHAAIVGVGLSLTLVSIPLLVWLMNVHDDLPISRSWRDAIEIAVPLTMAVSFILFGGWSALNCVRFAIAFFRAHRGARRKWLLADRADHA